MIGIYTGTNDGEAFLSFVWTNDAVSEFLQRLIEANEKVRDVVEWVKA
jgi:hypothetical protein